MFGEAFTVNAHPHRLHRLQVRYVGMSFWASEFCERRVRYRKDENDLLENQRKTVKLFGRLCRIGK